MINNNMIQWNDLLPSVKQGGKAVYGDCLGGSWELGWGGEFAQGRAERLRAS